MNRQEKICLERSVTVVMQYGSTLDTYTVVVLVIVVTVVTIVTVGRKKTCLQDFAIVCISNSHYEGFDWPRVCALLAIVFSFLFFF